MNDASEPTSTSSPETADASDPSDRGRAPGRYKVVELSTVTDEAIEEVLNRWTSEGWLLEGIHFAMRESSKRPSMAFVVFARA